MKFSNEEQRRLVEVLREFSRTSKGKVYFVPNEGNAGDALIAAGMWCLFQKIGFQPIVCRAVDLPVGSYSIYAGGGNLIDAYDNCKNYLEICLSRKASAALVLPHTIRGNEEILSRLDGRFTLFCRETASFEWAKKAAPMANVNTCEDMAFMLDLDWLKREGKKPTVKFSFWKHLLGHPKQLAKYLLWRRNKRSINPGSDGLLEIYRVDVEATELKPKNPRHDLSNLYGSQYLSREETLVVSQEFLDVIRPSKRVKTNRLHVAVGAALLNKETVIFDNSYGKNSAIYYKSLTQYNNVRLDGVSRK
ncbi:polysaccharide pyruvyl transferase family protein [Pseudomonas sp. GL-RE-19]|uniref:polysaccharide pyruvyl transferase family protein n=1 Tax=Pseudomonas sp. GL-RE-19 TaxID=2832389 RepID=UPI001CBF2C1A|nr:polysaccharide pyruvyl transferase family protein [Pseudomonas sp. GL-RE-19]